MNDEDQEEVPPYALFPGYQQRDRQPLPAILPPHDDIYQDADESQPLTSESQQETPTHIPNQMMVTPAVSAFCYCFYCFNFIHIQDFYWIPITNFVLDYVGYSRFSVAFCPFAWQINIQPKTNILIQYSASVLSFHSIISNRTIYKYEYFFELE